MPLNSDLDNLLDPLIGTFDATLLANIEGELTTIYISGDAQMTEWAGLVYEGPPTQEAIRFASTQGARLVTQMDEETKRRLAQVISDGIKNKRGIPGIVSDIRKELKWMARGGPSEITGLTQAARAEMIARTETANALGAAFTERGRQLGVTGKEWVTAGDERVDAGGAAPCLDNEAQGVIPFNQAFTSGHMTPPAHPNCRCATAPVML